MCVDRRRATDAACRWEQPVAVFVIPDQQRYIGGASHGAEYLRHPGMQSCDAGFRAQRL